MPPTSALTLTWNVPRVNAPQATRMKNGSDELSDVLSSIYEKLLSKTLWPKSASQRL